MTNKMLIVDSDAWSHGQITSKLWLCKEIEQLFGFHARRPPAGLPAESGWRLALYGGWYGITAFLLLSRGEMPVREIRSYDVDPACEPVADKVNNAWELTNWRFKAFTQDCNEIDWDSDFHPSGWRPEMVINTATEHFRGTDWWSRIPSGIWVTLQGTDMDHTDHHAKVESLDQFKELYPVRQLEFASTLPIQYPDWSFQRFMLIGKK
jgi:hypothetical protein